jgi:small subunit ribosomal protein S17
MSEQVSKNLRTLIGVVTSDKMSNSLVVKVERRVEHPIFGKIMRRSSKLHVNDPSNLGRNGDIVKIRECRPLSRTKNWDLVEVLEKAE